MHWFYPAESVCTVSIVCVFVSISTVWVISRLPESYWAKSSALRFIAHRALCPKESNSYLLIILLEEGNVPCFSTSTTEQTLPLTAVLILDCRLDWAQLERTLMAFFASCVHALTSFLLFEWRKNLPWPFALSSARLQEAKGLMLGVFIVIVEVFVWACCLPSTFWTMLCFPENRLRTHYN